MILTMQSPPFVRTPPGQYLWVKESSCTVISKLVFGPIRGTNGGFFRYAPQSKSLTRHAQLKIPNPWGIAVDSYGQEFFLFTSGPNFAWMLPGNINARYGANLSATDLLESNKVRPTSGLEIVSSRHFPDEVQGDVLINNNIGFLGIKQHQKIDDDPGFKTKYRQDLLYSTDTNFRPVDLEFAPDGSLYVVDWHNALIGHMQHNARDPNRDHVHGRIYRITYPSRPLIKPAKIDGATIPELWKISNCLNYAPATAPAQNFGQDTQIMLPKQPKNGQWLKAMTV